MFDFFTLDDYYEDFRQKYGDGDYAMGLAEDAARVDHQTMLAAEEYRRGPSPPLTYEEQKVLSMPIGHQRNREHNGTRRWLPLFPLARHCSN